ncbi:MAG: hypothetical protein JO171_09845 [Paludibacterium sp.]|nr:hypothetical protein [Paludibacterium sp.]
MANRSYARPARSARGAVSAARVLPSTWSPRVTDALDDAAPTEPIPPEDSMCCGSGCEFCVWTVYFAELASYRQALADWQARQNANREEPHG